MHDTRHSFGCFDFTSFHNLHESLPLPRTLWQAVRHAAFYVYNERVSQPGWCSSEYCFLFPICKFTGRFAKGNRLASHHSEPPVAAALAFGTLEIQPRTARLEDSQGQDTCLWEGTGYPYAGNHAFQRPTLPEILLHYIWDLCAWGPEACKAKMASHFDLFAANTQINCGTSMCIWLLMMYNYCYNSLPSSPPPPCYARGSWHGVACRTWNLAKSSRRTWTGHFLVRIVMNT